MDSNFLYGLEVVIGTPQNFAGEIVLYSLAGLFFIGVSEMIFIFVFRVLTRW